MAFGVFALAAKKKTGNLYLQIDGPDLASIVECPKDDNTRARQFAIQILNAGKRAASIEAQLPALIQGAEKSLKDATNNTGRIHAAQTALVAAENDSSLAEAIRSADAHVLAAQARLAGTRSLAGLASALGAPTRGYNASGRSRRTGPRPRAHADGRSLQARWVNI